MPGKQKIFPLSTKDFYTPSTSLFTLNVYGIIYNLHTARNPLPRHCGSPIQDSGLTEWGETGCVHLENKRRLSGLPETVWSNTEKFHTALLGFS